MSTSTELPAFEVIYADLPKNGWLSKGEAHLLWDTAQRTTGAILEVGTYYGRSLCLLAALGRYVYAVDPLTGFDSEDPSGDRIDRALSANLAARCITNVSFFRQRIEDWESRSVGFAYLDGDHTQIGTRNQVVKALQCGAQVIAAHDVGDTGDGLVIKQVLLETLGPWRERVERLAVWDINPETT